MLMYRERDDKVSQGGVRMHTNEALMVPIHVHVALDDAPRVPIVLDVAHACSRTLE